MRCYKPTSLFTTICTAVLLAVCNSPAQTAPQIISASIVSNEFLLNFTTEPWMAYQLEYSSNLFTGWSAVEPWPSALGQKTQPASMSNGFYRLRVWDGLDFTSNQIETLSDWLEVYHDIFDGMPVVTQTAWEIPGSGSYPSNWGDILNDFPALGMSVDGLTRYIRDVIPNSPYNSSFPMADQLATTYDSLAYSSNLVGYGDTYWTNRLWNYDDIWGNSYMYIPNPTNVHLVRILSRGPDGLFGTSDDYELDLDFTFLSGGTAASSVLIDNISSVFDSVESAFGAITNERYFTSAGPDLASDVFVPAFTNFIPTSLKPGYTNFASIADPRFFSVPGGRLAFVGVDTSGMLDIGATNAAGGAARRYGLSSSEIAIQSLPEVGDSSGFVQARTNFLRALNLRDLYHAGRVFGGLTEFPANSVHYSRYIPESWTNKVDVSGDPSGWDTNAVLDALRDSFAGATLANQDKYAHMVFSNMIDYVDTDDIPQNLGMGSVEAIPMINELKLVYGVNKVAGGAFSGGMTLEYELAYPFQRDTTAPYDIRVVDVVITNLGLTTNPDLLPSTPSLPYLLNNAYPAGQKSTFITTVDNPFFCSGTDTNPLSRANFQVEIKLELLRGGVPVDSVPFPLSSAGITLDVDLFNVGEGAYTTTNWIECNDPRYNWDPSDLVQWHTASDITKVVSNAVPTMGTTNTYTSLNFFPELFGTTHAAVNGAELDLDNDMFMHVANQPFTTVGELGHLSFAFWRTLRLFKHDDYDSASHADPPAVHPIFDYFRVGDSTEQRGLINPNSCNTSTVQAAFLDLPFNIQQEEGDWQGLNASDSLALAQMIISNAPYTNVSAFAELTGWTDIVGGRGVNEMKAETLLANSIGLFGLGNQTFSLLILVEVTDYPASFFDERQWAAMTIWRNPYPDENGKHDYQLIDFAWLNDLPSYSPGAEELMFRLRRTTYGASLSPPELQVEMGNSFPSNLSYYAVQNQGSLSDRAIHHYAYSYDASSSMFKEVITPLNLDMTLRPSGMTTNILSTNMLNYVMTFPGLAFTNALPTNVIVTGDFPGPSTLTNQLNFLKYYPNSYLID